MNVVFHMTPNSTGEKRYWDKFPQLAQHLVKAYSATITVVGSPGDAAYVNRFLSETQNITHRIRNLVGQTTLDELITVLKECHLLVCVNSFVMHLGVALEVRMFAIVGATEPKVVLPPGIPHAYALYANDIPLQAVIDGINSSLKTV